MSEPSTAPWRSDYQPTPSIISRLVTPLLPSRVPPTHIEALAEGWDNFAFALDSEWIARVPKRANVLPMQAIESRALRAIEGRLPLATPAELKLTEPCEACPFPIMVYRRVPGQPLRALNQNRDVGPQVAAGAVRFFAALHATPLERLGDVELPRRGRLEAVIERVIKTVQAAPGLRATHPLLAAAFEALRSAPRTLPGPTQEVLLHDDLHASHLMVDSERLEAVGVIDWGDVGRGDPARDLCEVMGWGGAEPVQAALASIERPAAWDDAILQRSSWYLLARASRIYLDAVTPHREAAPVEFGDTLENEGRHLITQGLEAVGVCARS